MYSRCKNLEEARRIFDQTPRRTAISWNLMIGAYTHNGLHEEALHLFEGMPKQGDEQPNRFTFLATLSACTSLRNLPSGKWIHDRIIASGFQSDMLLITSLISMYGKCGSPENALLVFENSPTKCIASWNAMITTYAQNGHAIAALTLFQSMIREDSLVPNKVTFLGIISACSHLNSIKIGKAIHEGITKTRFYSDIAIKTALIHMYGKCGSLEEAFVVFNEICQRDVISWTAMIIVYIENGHGKEAMELLNRMEREGVKPNKVTFLSTFDACDRLISMEICKAVHQRIIACGFESDDDVKLSLLSSYVKCGSLKEARAVFDRASGQNIMLWTAMIAAYAHNGQCEEAFELFEHMKAKGIVPDKIAFLRILDACANLGSLDYGRAIHVEIIVNGFDSDDVIETALLSMYAKCGSLKDAQASFNKLRNRDVISWTAMIAAYTQSGQSEDALELFRRMESEGIEPNAITFLSIIEACARLNSLENGSAIHERIIASGFDSVVAIKTALLDMYGKCGSLKKAREVFDGMCRPSVISWTAMILAYAQSGCSKEALELFKHMKYEGLRPDSITFLGVLNTCNHAGLVGEGWRCLISLSVDYGVIPLADHYVCMIDLLARAGFLDEAEDLMNNMHVRADTRAWTALLGAC